MGVSRHFTSVFFLKICLNVILIFHHLSLIFSPLPSLRPHLSQLLFSSLLIFLILQKKLQALIPPSSLLLSSHFILS